MAVGGTGCWETEETLSNATLHCKHRDTNIVKS